MRRSLVCPRCKSTNLAGVPERWRCVDCAAIFAKRLAMLIPERTIDEAAQKGGRAAAALRDYQIRNRGRGGRG